MWVIEGEVRNGGNEPIDGLTVTGSWFTTGRPQPIREQAGEVERSRLAPGETSTFRVSTRGDNNVDAGSVSTKVTFRRQNGELTLTDARSAAPEAPESPSDADAPPILDDPRDAPGTAVPLAEIYAAYQANPEGTLQAHGGGVFTGRVDTVQRLDRSPQWAAYATFDGGKVAAYFLPEDWSQIPNPVIAGQIRTFMCLEADATRMPQLLLMACDVADR
jgi:hypothetical protein